MSRHELEQDQAAKERKPERTKEAFPGFFRADVRDHLVAADRAAGQIRAHVAELRHRDQIQDIKLSGYRTGARARREIKNFRREIEQPKHVKQTEERVSHRLQRLVVPQSLKHLSPEHGEQEKKQDPDFKIV